MKMNASKKVHYDSGPNMTPLVDVVMVILIFLMLAGSFGGAEHYMVSNIPFKEKGVGGQAAPKGMIPDEPLDIRVDSTADRWVAQVGRLRASDVPTLTSQLRKMRQDLNSTGKKTDNIQVVISPGKNVKYDYLIGVYQAALEAEFTKISFATAH